MVVDERYVELLNTEIQKRLPAPFFKLYSQNMWLHDWYLVSMLVANTGESLGHYSKKGGTTIQLRLTNTLTHILLSYIDVVDFQVSYNPREPNNRFRYTGFGQCLCNKFEIDEDYISHHYEFEFDDNILIKCKSIKFRKIHEVIL